MNPVCQIAIYRAALVLLKKNLCVVEGTGNCYYPDSNDEALEIALINKINNLL